MKFVIVRGTAKVSVLTAKFYVIYVNNLQQC